MRIYTILISLLIFPIIASAQSKPPSPCPSELSKVQQPEPTPKETLSNGKQHGTDNFPIFVKISKLGESRNPKKSKNTNPTKDKPSYDWGTILLVIFNGLLALFNFGLLVSNYKLWGATKDTAEAAKKSADALPTIERAYLFANIAPTNMNPLNDPLEVTLGLRNEGKTPAIITDIHIGLTGESACPTDMKKARNIPITEGMIIRGGGSHDRSVSFYWADITTQEPRQKDPDMIFYGHIIYEDIFGGTHTERFCWHHDSIALREGVYFRRCSNKEAKCHT